jgi:Sulfotransferase family
VTQDVLYIGGFGRSGSTLIERSIGELSDACAVGELVHLWERGLQNNELCGCGLAFRDCPFWAAVGLRAFGGWESFDVAEALRLKHAVDRNRFVPRLLLPWPAGVFDREFRRELRAYVALYDAIYQAVAEESGAKVVIDSSKHASLALCLRRASRHRIRVAHVVRDSPAVAYSWSKVVARPEAAGDDEMARYSAPRAALWWNVYNLMFALIRRVHLPLRRVRYEDFVADPLPVIRDLAAWGGSDADPGAFLRDHTVQLSQGHTVAGNPMRFRVGEIAIKRDDQWRTAMPAALQRRVRLLTWPFRLAYGYAGGSPVARKAPDRADTAAASPRIR